ncbi:MAG: SemiSWEET transporter [Gammaproteobacteria bacterium]|nr:SemiSWEET transporter [Gammaproteobacteria bacterium]MBU6509945.1 SemiSWEET transporter [Gammaproteobacteria bacterium]MDE1983284.1 SemiSWEET transporter [Gammaproteobacteria bacterium]MDE2108049.1 SemiSWEET transporter [Gammaproteobacteria bacterium]MDE2460972.1 SemiSWEET transporter [Gammaproteobacteria bacterium]
MNIPRIIGLTAATLTTLAFIPQVWRTLKTHDTRGISLGMYAIYTVGIALWLVYGLLIHDLVVTLANAVTLFLAAIILTLKLRYG